MRLFKGCIRVSVAILALGCASLSHAADIRVMSSGGFYSAMEALAPIFEKQTGHKVTLISGSSTGSSPTSIPMRLSKGEVADLLMMASTELDKLIAQGMVVAGSRKDLVESRIGMVVRAGAVKPDISTAEAFKKALQQASSIGFSASISGNYLATEVFPTLDSTGQIQSKARQVVQERVAAVVARGELEVGFQQVSELISTAGVDFVGPIPAPYQKATVFSVGVSKNSPEPAASQELVSFLGSAVARPIIEKQGLVPLKF